MTEARIENGFAIVAAGTYLTGKGQPAAFGGTMRQAGLKGFVVPDRGAVQQMTLTGTGHFSAAEAPFLTRLDALPDEALKVISRKVLVAPFESRTGGQSLKLIPFSFARSRAVTQFRTGWVVVATKSRVSRVTVAEGETFTVRPEALVAWIGNDPTGFCPKLNVVDMILPRGPKNLAYTFQENAVVWIEGAAEAAAKRPAAAWARRSA